MKGLGIPSPAHLDNLFFRNEVFGRESHFVAFLDVFEITHSSAINLVQGLAQIERNRCDLG